LHFYFHYEKLDYDVLFRFTREKLLFENELSI